MNPLPQASEAQYALKAASDPVPAVKLRPAANAVGLGNLLIQQLMNVLVGIAALALALRRKASVIVRQFGIIGVGTMAILVLTRLSGTIAQAYNPQRAFMQGLIVLGICLCLVFQELGAKRRRARPWILTIGAASVAVFFLGTSGLIGAYLGGGAPSNLANSYDDYQQFVSTTPELAAAQWVSKTVPVDQLIYADHYAELRLETVQGLRNGVFDAVTPETIDQNAWVYASRTNMVDGIARSYSGNTEGIYAFPEKFLFQNFNTVYTNGTSEVFHR